MDQPVTIIVDRPQRRDYAIKVIGRLPVEDGECWDVIIGRHRKKRSLKANARLWLLHTAAAKHVGCSPEDMHEDCLADHFGSTEVRLPSGNLKRIPNKRSSDLDTKGFAEFMEFCESRYITELGVFLDHDGSR